MLGTQVNPSLPRFIPGSAARLGTARRGAAESVFTGISAGRLRLAVRLVLLLTSAISRLEHASWSLVCQRCDALQGLLFAPWPGLPALASAAGQPKGARWLGLLVVPVGLLPALTTVIALPLFRGETRRELSGHYHRWQITHHAMLPHQTIRASHKHGLTHNQRQNSRGFIWGDRPICSVLPGKKQTSTFLYLSCSTLF